MNQRSPILRIRHAFISILRAIRPSPPVRRFLAHNRATWRDFSHQNSGAVVLVDLFDVPQTVVPTSYLSNVLAAENGATIWAFSTRPLVKVLHGIRVFRSFNARRFLRPRLGALGRMRARREAAALLEQCETREDILGLNVSGLQIGKDVYESFLKRHNEPTVTPADDRLSGILAEAIGYLWFWSDFLRTQSVAAIVASHPSYIENNVLNRLAYREDIPVYIPWIDGLIRLREEGDTFARFRNYRTYFSHLSSGEAQAAMSDARARLEARLAGDISDISYAAKVDHGTTAEVGPIIEDSDRFNVLIATHCFFDNPHVYGGLLFNDFYEWLHFLGDASRTTDYDWYLKLHPEPLEGTRKVVDEFLQEFDHIREVPSTTAHSRLAEEGLDAVLTCYGTVGEEYPALGVPVLNAGYNPRISYNFNWHPQSVAELGSLIHDLPNRCLPIDQREVEEFYFVHHQYTYDDRLLGPSFREFLKSRTGPEREGPAVYEWYLERTDSRTHAQVAARIRAYVRSGKRYLFPTGPSD